MGARGPGAKPIAKRLEVAPKLRSRFPWHRKGLSTAERVIAFANWLPMTSGKQALKKRFRLRPWQCDFIRAVFAEDRKGVRPVRMACLTIPRKNGNTALASILCLAALLGPLAEIRGQVLSAANDRKQAGFIFDEMAALIDAVPEFAARVNVKHFEKCITVLSGDSKGSIFKALSSKAPGVHGLSPVLAVYDEYGQSPNDALFQAIKTSFGARDEALMLVISTEAADDLAPMSRLVDYGKKVADGEVDDPAMHLTRYRAELTDDPYDPATWYKANPALGDFRSLIDLETQARAAKESPSEEPAFLNLTLNMRVAAEARFLNPAEWNACGDDPRPLKGRTAYGGLDLSWSRDLTALVFVAPDGEYYDIECRFFLPEHGILTKSADDRVPWKTWADQGYLTLTPGKTADLEFVGYAIRQAQIDYDLRAIGFDNWGMNNLRRELDKIGCDVPLEPIRQNNSEMSPCLDLVDRAVAESRLRHGMNPILKMCAANAVAVPNHSGHRRLEKNRSAGKIDGIVALAMAMRAAEISEKKPVPWAYRQFTKGNGSNLAILSNHINVLMVFLRQPIVSK